MPIHINELAVNLTAPDIFLHVQTKRAGKIKGEGTTQGHQDDIDVHGWSWGLSANTAIGSTAATARHSYKHLVVVKGLDSASTGLLNALVSNDEVREATLTLRKAGGEALDYYQMKLANARIVSVDIDIGVDGQPVERVAFAFTKIEIEYKRQQNTGLGAGVCSFHGEVLPA